MKTWRNYCHTHWRIIILATLVGAVLAFTTVALIPAKFQTEMQILIVQNHHADRDDTSAALRLTAYFTHVMKNSIHTTSFFHKVQEAPFAVRKTFTDDPAVRQKQWKSAVRVVAHEESGMIRVRVTDTSRTTAEETAKGIAYVLTTKNHDYRGANDGLVVRMVDGPTTPLTPTLPRITPWTIFGAVVGCSTAWIFIIFFPHLLPHKAVGRQEQSLRGVRHDDEMQADLAFVQKRDDDPVSESAIRTHFRPVAQRTEPRNLPIADQTLLAADVAAPMADDDVTALVTDDRDDVAALPREADAEVEDLHAQITAFHKNNPS